MHFPQLKKAWVLILVNQANNQKQIWIRMDKSRYLKLSYNMYIKSRSIKSYQENIHNIFKGNVK